MKSSANLFARFTLAVLASSLAGCQTQQAVTPLGNGYQQVSHPTRSYLDEPQPPRTSLEYRGTDGQSLLIWPALYGTEAVVKGSLAIFIADKAYLDPDKATHPRIFAVQSPALPLDITDEVLWRWSQANGKNFAATLNQFTAAVPAEKNGGLQLHLEFWLDNTLLSEDKNWPDQSDLQLDWSQVAAIMRAVKTKGVAQKDLRWRTPYIGEKF